MVRLLSKPELGVAYEAYRRHDAFFPLMGAVLQDQQDGLVLADDPRSPCRFYVEHAFGFAQVFGCDNAGFDEALRHYLLVEKSFVASKARLYTPVEPAFLRGPEFDHVRSERQRFILDPKRMDGVGDRGVSGDTGAEIRGAQSGDLAAIEARFGVVRRFWRSDRDFLASAHAIVAWVNGEPASICYAAAVARGVAEIDVYTHPEHRRAGLGKQVVDAFSRLCLGQGLLPVWDCFTNNAGSMALCKSCGFDPLRPAYPFYTLNK